MLYKVVIQRPVIGKPKPKQADLERNRRVVVVEARHDGEARARVRASDAMHGTTGEIVFVDQVPSKLVVLAP